MSDASESDFAGSDSDAGSDACSDDDFEYIYDCYSK